tara:strand:- start:230 stop:841 length:612 start_codon:yes stop_codon:yes gene_type:complete
MSLNFSDFIYCAENTLSEHFCQMCIDKFEADENKYKGLIGSGVYEPEFKDSTDLHISSLSDWKYEDGIFFKSLNEHLEKYMFSGLVKQFTGADHVDILMNGLDDTGYQIQRTEPGGGYTWHTDFNIIKPHIDNCGVRMLTFIWYLNDIVEDGYTEFVDGTKIQPERGKLLIFPSCWTFYHRGYPPKSETKYIATGWVHSIAPE